MSRQLHLGYVVLFSWGWVSCASSVEPKNLQASASAAAPAPVSVVPVESGPSASAAPDASAAPAVSAPKGMAFIPGGKLKIGRDDGGKSEAPAHEVTVASFFLDLTEVTVRDYATCVDAKKCDVAETGEFCNGNKPDRANHPINCVSFRSAEAYCSFVGKRLPTEEEWERAARADDGRLYPWGSTPPPNSDLICWKRLGEKLGTCEVGSHPKGASSHGVQDLSGNVNEWTSSKFCAYSQPDCQTELHSGRGGSWDYTNPANVSSVTRAGGGPDHARDLLGFRCAQSK